MSNDAPISNDDPRMGFAQVTQVLNTLIAGTNESQLGDATPCSEFNVKDLLNHLILVMRRVEALGNGAHWSTVTDETASVETGHAEAFTSAAHGVMQAWTDAAKLDAMYEVPWGELPGGPMMFTYTAELATHAWDLATATDQAIDISDETLGGALFAAKMLPAEGRDHPDMPFDEVVDPGPDAPVLLQLAGWMGRQVV